MGGLEGGDVVRRVKAFQQLFLFCISLNDSWVGSREEEIRGLLGLDLFNEAAPFAVDGFQW